MTVMQKIGLFMAMQSSNSWKIKIMSNSNFKSHLQNYIMYFETMFNVNNLDLTKIFKLPRLTTYSTCLRSFQYKILHNILFLNEKFYFFWITKSLLCSYYNTYDEIPIHLFCECDYTKYLWLQLNRHFNFDLTLPVSTPQTVILGLFKDSANEYTSCKLYFVVI